MPAKKPRKPNKRSTNRKQPSPSVSGQAARKCETVFWPIDQLHPHPRQDELFLPLPEKQFEDFVADIRRRRIQQPPEILVENAAGLVPGTLLIGHQRVRAAKVLGFTEIEVRIRHDLAQASSEELEEIVIGDNFYRRQVTPLQQAKLTLRLYELELERLPGPASFFDEQTARQRIADRINRSSKTVERHLAILRTPIEVQQAYNEERLKIEPAVKVAHLPQDVQQKIAEQIRAGQDPQSVVNPFLQKKALRNKRTSPLQKATQLLQQAMQLVPTDVDTIAAECPGGVAAEMLSTLEDLQRLAPKLSSALSQAKKRSDDKVQQMLSELRADC